MNSRSTTALVLALVLILCVMGVAAALTFSGGFSAAKYAAPQVWAQPFASAQSMKIIDLTGDKQNDLFLQNENSLAVLDASGKTIFKRAFAAPLVTTLGDVNGDGTDEIVAAAPSGPSMSVAALTGKGEVVWTAEIKNVGKPYRAAVARFADGTQVVVGDEKGQLVALASTGQEVWRATTSITDYIRGLDDISVNGVRYLAGANHNGMVVLLDARGKAQWTYSAGTLRRLRAYDLGSGGKGNLLVGTESGRLIVLDAATGKEIVAYALGQTVTEIRDAEVDGNPSTREFVVGGKDGGVWAFRGASAERLWSGSVSDKVNEIAALDVDEDGAEEVIIGDDSGAVTLFTKTGERRSLLSRRSAIGRIDAGRLTGSDQIAVADGSGVQLLALGKESPPTWYSPLLVGLLVSIVIAIVAWFLATIPPKPALRVAIEDQSVEGLQAQLKMLHENIADVERLKGAGEMAPEAYLARLKELRRQLADTEAGLQKAGAPVKVETFKCPNCGGTLMLGMDKCEYCGQVVIS